MNTFYLFLCCSVTLALVVLITTSHPPLLQQGDSSLQDLHNVMVDEAKRVAKQDHVKQLHHQGHYEQAAMIIPSIRVSLQKLASSLLVHVPHFHNHQYDVNYLHLKYMAARRFLLHEEIMRTTTVTITASGASGNTHDTQHEHDVNESTAFHVDYSGPKTHPPKNN